MGAQYRYVVNAPTNFVDRSGLAPVLASGAPPEGNTTNGRFGLTDGDGGVQIFDNPDWKPPPPPPPSKWDLFWSWDQQWHGNREANGNSQIGGADDWRNKWPLLGNLNRFKQALENGAALRALYEGAMFWRGASNLEQILDLGNDGSCFPAGTLVDTSTGLTPIETVRSGDQLWGYCLTSSRWRLCSVIQTFRRRVVDTNVLVTVADDTIQSTYHHPFWVVRGEELTDRPREDHHAPIPPTATTEGRWVDAGDLRIGDTLLLRDGREMPVQALRRVRFEGDVYNFEVADLNTYAVGVHSVLVHNAPNGGPQWEEHHSDPEWAGGDPNQETTTMEAGEHDDLHREMNHFLRGQPEGDMSPHRGNTGDDILEKFGRDKILEKLGEFYRWWGGPAANDFFDQHPELLL